MRIKKPTTSGQRKTTTKAHSGLTKEEPEKSLTLPLERTGGRGISGKVTVRHRGKREKRKYRQIDFGQQKIGIPATVEALEYDPNRSAFIMLLKYKDGTRSYRLAPEDIKVGDEVVCDEKAPIKIGNRLKFKNIPLASFIFNIELIPGKGGKIVRSAGASAQILSKEKGYATVSLPSKEIRRVSEECFATLGQVSNPGRKTEVLGKAGKKRHRGIKPTVRGTAMRPRDHPHGGGKGKAPIGLKYPKTPWSKHAYGKKTRKKRKFSDRFIIKRRK